MRKKISFDTGAIIGLLASIPVVYFGTYPALNLISQASQPFDTQKIRLARLCGLATFALQTAIILLIRHLAPNSFYQQRTVPGLLIRQASESLIGALPFVMLFISFSLLASKEPEQYDFHAPDPTLSDGAA